MLEKTGCRITQPWPPRWRTIHASRETSGTVRAGRLSTCCCLLKPALAPPSHGGWDATPNLIQSYVNLGVCFQEPVTSTFHTKICKFMLNWTFQGFSVQDQRAKWWVGDSWPASLGLTSSTPRAVQPCWENCSGPLRYTPLHPWDTWRGDTLPDVTWAGLGRLSLSLGEGFFHRLDVLQIVRNLGFMGVVCTCLNKSLSFIVLA